MDLNNVPITITPTRQLISINENLTNFQASFSVTSDKKEPFRALVVPQAALDALPENGALEMENAPQGIFSGTIKFDSGTKDNWYIVLEAEKDVAAHVNVHAGEIDPEAEAAAAEAEFAGAATPKKKGIPFWLILLILAALVLGGFLVYKFCFASKGDGAAGDATTALPSPVNATPKQLPPTAMAPPEEPPLKLDFSDLPEL